MEAIVSPSTSCTITHYDKGVYPFKAAYNVNYCTIEKRIESFRTWPPALKQQGLQFSLAGFYYTKFSDIVRCFLCSLTLDSWMPEDSPILRHIERAPSCIYAKLHKTISYNQEDDSTCGICNSAPRNLVLLPCRHFITCTLCTFGLSNCPICKSHIEKIMHIYTS